MGQWSSIRVDREDKSIVWPGSTEAQTFNTGVNAELLKKIGESSVSVPEGFVSYHHLRSGYIGLPCNRKCILDCKDISKPAWGH